MTNRAIVVLSGGQDSTTCLGVALKECTYVEAVIYDYGQKHRIEIDAALKICAAYGIDFTLIDLKPVLSNMKSSALVTHGDTTQPHEYLKNLPASFVPVRNVLFLSIAYGLAMEHKLNRIYAGMCQTDYSGYPDCRYAFISDLNLTLNEGYDSDIQILTPLMFLTKAQTFALAEEVGILKDVLDNSITCYEGVTTMNAWGMGCGECPACKLRAKGWKEFTGEYESS